MLQNEAKNRPPLYFPSIILLLDHLSKIWGTTFWPSGKGCQKCISWLIFILNILICEAHSITKGGANFTCFMPKCDHVCPAHTCGAVDFFVWQKMLQFLKCLWPSIQYLPLKTLPVFNHRRIFICNLNRLSVHHILRIFKFSKNLLN